jgi:hypothetical protein
VRKEISRPSVKKFVEACLASGMTSPSEMRDAYETQWKKKYTDQAFIMAMRRNGVSSEQRCFMSLLGLLLKYSIIKLSCDSAIDESSTLFIQSP